MEVLLEREGILCGFLSRPVLRALRFRTRQGTACSVQQHQNRLERKVTSLPQYDILRVS